MGFWHSAAALPWAFGLLAFRQPLPFGLVRSLPCCAVCVSLRRGFVLSAAGGLLASCFQWGGWAFGIPRRPRLGAFGLLAFGQPLPFGLLAFRVHHGFPPRGVLATRRAPPSARAPRVSRNARVSPSSIGTIGTPAPAPAPSAPPVAHRVAPAARETTGASAAGDRRAGLRPHDRYNVWSRRRVERAVGDEQRLCTR